MSKRPCTLYRFYDIEGRLLYVGISIRPWQRFAEHRAAKAWWTDSERIHLEHFASVEEAREAETRAIRDERPLFNTASQVTTGPWPWEFEVILRAEPQLAAVVEEIRSTVECPWFDNQDRYLRWHRLISERLGKRRGSVYVERANDTVSTKHALDDYLSAMEDFYSTYEPPSSIDRFLATPDLDRWFVEVTYGLFQQCDHDHEFGDWEIAARWGTA